MPALLQRLADLVVARPGRVALGALVVAVALSAPATNTRLSSGNDAFAPDTPELLALEDEQQLFAGATDLLVQVVVSGGPVVSADGVATVTTLQAALREQLDPDLLVDAPGRGPLSSWLTPVLVAAELRGQDPATLDDGAVAELRDDVLAQLPPAVRARVEGLVADDGLAGLLLVRLDRDAITADAQFPVEELTAASQQVADVVAGTDTPLRAETFSFELLISPDETFQREVSTRLAAATAIIALVLLAVFRAARATGVARSRPLRRATADTLLALGVAGLAIGVQQGVGVLLGPDGADVVGYFSPPTQIVPVLLIALGVDYAIHLQERYAHVLGTDGPDVATRTALLGVGPALALASATTAIGFLANLFSPTPAIQDLGVLAAVGLLAAFLLAVTLFPAARLLLDRRAVRSGALSPTVAPTPDDDPATADADTHDGADATGHGPDGPDGPDVPPSAAADADHPGPLQRLARSAAEPALAAPGLLLAGMTALALAGAVGLTQLGSSYDFADFVPQDAPVAQAYETLQARFGGGVGQTTTVLVRGDVADAAVLNAALEVEQRIALLAQVRKVDGIALVDGPAGVLRPALQLATADAGQLDDPALQLALPGDAAALRALGGAALDAGIDPETLLLPEDAEVGALFDALAEAAPGLVAEGADGRPQALRIVATAPTTPERVPLLRDDVRDAAEPLVAASTRVDVVSQAIVSDVSVGLLQSSQARSVVTTILAVLALLVLVYGVRDRRPLLGGLLVVPVVFATLWTFGLMWVLGIDLDPATATVAALVVGVGIDYVIHVGERFTQELRRVPAVAPALRATLERTGGALAGSGITTTVGFAVLLTSSLPPFRSLGLVIVLAIGLSLVSALLVAPPLLVLWSRLRGVPTWPVVGTVALPGAGQRVPGPDVPAARAHAGGATPVEGPGDTGDATAADGPGFAGDTGHADDATRADDTEHAHTREDAPTSADTPTTTGVTAATTTSAHADAAADGRDPVDHGAAAPATDHAGPGTVREAPEVDVEPTAPAPSAGQPPLPRTGQPDPDGVARPTAPQVAPSAVPTRLRPTAGPASGAHDAPDLPAGARAAADPDPGPAPSESSSDARDAAGGAVASTDDGAAGGRSGDTATPAAARRHRIPADLIAPVRVSRPGPPEETTSGPPPDTTQGRPPDATPAPSSGPAPADAAPGPATTEDDSPPEQESSPEQAAPTPLVVRRPLRRARPQTPDATTEAGDRTDPSRAATGPVGAAPTAHGPSHPGGTSPSTAPSEDAPGGGRTDPTPPPQIRRRAWRSTAATTPDGPRVVRRPWTRPDDVGAPRPEGADAVSEREARRLPLEDVAVVPDTDPEPSFARHRDAADAPGRTGAATPPREPEHTRPARPPRVPAETDAAAPPREPTNTRTPAERPIPDDSRPAAPRPRGSQDARAATPRRAPDHTRATAPPRVSHDTRAAPPPPGSPPSGTAAAASRTTVRLRKQDDGTYRLVAAPVGSDQPRRRVRRVVRRDERGALTVLRDLEPGGGPGDDDTTDPDRT